MARKRGKTETPEDGKKVFFLIEDVPKSWFKLPLSRFEAINTSRDLKWYFTRKPCMHGHYSIRLVKSNSCYACMAIRQEKNNEYYRIYYKNNRKKINNLVKARRADPNDDFQKREQKRTKKYRERNSTEVKKRGREKANKRYWNDPEKARAYARESAKLDHNKTARNERLKNKRLNDPTFIVIERTRTRIRGGYFVVA